jgi:predicted NAD-dependent protein-ADP-ribosyltransferase YbiA (DUF1768 family)
MTSIDFIQYKNEAVYSKNSAAWFCTKNDPRWIFSNMAGGMPLYFPLERLPQNEWHASEQLYQACKYSTNVMCRPETNPDADPCVRNRIRGCNNPRGAKMTQKCAVKAGLVRSDWEHPDHEVRIQAMLWVLELKLYWNTFNFGLVLKETGNLPIVEISKKDAFWGCREYPDGQLHGCNVLGKLLMDLRSRIDSIKRGQFSSPDGWLLP